MLHLRLVDVKDLVARVTGLCVDDARVVDYINRAVERLLYEGKSKGTVQRVQMCVTSEGCLTFPREIETIEAVAVGGRPGTVRNSWYEFLPAGPGVFGSCGSRCWTGAQLVDAGEYPAFDDVVGTGKKLAVYSTETEDADSTITLQFLDPNGEFVTKTFGSELVDGERITLPAKGAYAYTTNVCQAGGLLRVYKDRTVGVVRLFEYDPANAVFRALGNYQPDETAPIYRRSLIPGLCPSEDDPVSVTVQAKLRFIPVSSDNDFLLISHRDAIKLAAQGVLKEDNSKFEEAAACFAMAMRLLDKQLQHHLGDGAVAPIAFVQTHMPAITNII